jgi:hypothetical protein
MRNELGSSTDANVLNAQADELDGEGGEPLHLSLRPAVLDRDVPTLQVAEVAESTP